MQEHTLSGGIAPDRVLHVGETVRKPWTAATPSVTAFVRAVLAAGVDVPQPLGKDEDGRSVQEFVHGTRAMDLAPMALDDPTRVGSIVRAIHDASAERMSFHAAIGVDIKGEVWSCVEIPESAEFFGTGKSVRVDAVVDDVRLENVGAMVTGTGGHMISLSAKVRKALGKDIGDTVDVAITRR